MSVVRGRPPKRRQQDRVHKMLRENIVERLAGHEQPGEQHRRADLGQQGGVGRDRDLPPGGCPGDDDAEHLALSLEDLLPHYCGQFGIVVHRAEEPEDQGGVLARQAGAHGLQRRLQVGAKASRVGRRGGGRGLASMRGGRPRPRALPCPASGGRWWPCWTGPALPPPRWSSGRSRTRPAARGWRAGSRPRGSHRDRLVPPPEPLESKRCRTLTTASVQIVSI